MSMVKYSIGLIVLIWLTLIVLMPKQELYYKLEEILVNQDIVLQEEKVQEGFFGLKLENVRVYIKGINVANIKKINLFTLLFYSRMEVDMLHIDESLKSMMPLETEKAIFEYSVLSPFSVSTEAEGSFGFLIGKIDIREKNVRLDFNESKNIQMLKPPVQKMEKGWIYETSF